MHENLPSPIRWLVRKLSFFAIPNLGMIIAGLAVLAFVAKYIWQTPTERFVFDPQLVLDGEWWRLFAFPIQESSSPFWFLFFVLYVYFVMGALEQAWGAGPLTLFVLFGYVAAIAGAFLKNESISVWYYVLENVSLAFGTLFPDFEFLLFFILPVRAKWLAWLAAGIIGIQFLIGSLLVKVFLLVVLTPYFCFFGPMLLHKIKMRRLVSRNRRQFYE